MHIRWRQYWSNISSVDSYFRTNMDFLKKDVRDYFFNQLSGHFIQKVEDLPPAKVHIKVLLLQTVWCQADVLLMERLKIRFSLRKSLSVTNCVIKNSIILNDVYIGDNTYIRKLYRGKAGDTIRANTKYVGEIRKDIRIVIEKNDRYAL